jgi:MFS superfamily sulfate permease-like transporter
LQFYPFAMMVKFTTDKLTFANTAHLKEGLNRLEKHGRLEGSHPGDAPTRFPEQNVNLVFDFSNVTYVDSSATQILRQIFQAHLQDGSLIYFAGLNPVVKGIFTKARVWALFGEGEWCGKDVPEAMTLADAREGNLEEARRRAIRGGRGANFEAEEDRLQYYTGQRRLDPGVP